MPIHSVAVFCGSSDGHNPVFREQATELGKLLALNQLKCVYGGGSRGLMGRVADSLLENKGHILGIMPELLKEREHQHQGLTELTIVPDMHVRKKMMYEKSDAAIILPGGFGTLDELFEMLTWNQLKIHNKKIYILNSAGYYDFLREQLLKMWNEGFLYENPGQRIGFFNTVAEIIHQLTQKDS